jgi:hypothetical protein
MWPHIRAGLVTLHLIAITLLALPAPEGGMDRQAWQNPTVQDEFRAWSHTLTSCGLIITPTELEDRLWTIAQRYMALRGGVLQPFGPYYTTCGTFQGWRMFVGPHRFPLVLHIDIAEQGQWRPVYIERDSQYRWRSRQLDSYRFRAALFRLGWPGYEGELQRFAQWVARQAAADFPQAEQVRVRFFQRRTPSPEEVRAGAAIAGAFGPSLELPLKPPPVPPPVPPPGTLP